MKRIREFFRNAAEWVVILFVFAIVTWFVGGLLKLASPIFTALFVFMGTMYAIENKQGVFSVGGLVLYAASWPAVGSLGQLGGAAVFGLGMIMWFAAIHLAFDHSHKPRLATATS